MINKISSVCKPTIYNKSKVTPKAFSKATMPQINELTNCCNYSAVSFGQKQKQIDLLSKEYSEKCYFPTYKKIPDGFKFMQTKYIFSDDGLDKKGRIAKSLEDIAPQEQITLINRHKDPFFQTIEKAYNTNFSIWQNEFKKDNTFSKNDKKNIIIDKTASFVRSMNGLNLPERVRNCESNNFIKGKESYLGEIFAQKADVCRHDAFLFKMLLQDKGIDTGIQSGYAFSKDYPTYHTWNTIKTTDGKEIPFDINADLENVFLFDNDGNVLYQDSMSKAKLTKLDILSLQYDDKLTLGYDKKGEIVSEKRNTNIEPLISIRTEKNGDLKFEPQKDLTPDEEKIVDNLKQQYNFRAIYPFLGMKFNSVKKQLFNLPNLNKFQGPKAAIDSLGTDLNETTKSTFANWLTRGM